MGLLNYNFDWSILWKEPYGLLMIKGILTTIHLSILAWLVAIFLGVIIAIIGVLSHKRFQFISTVYIQVFRNVPFLVQLFFWYFAVPLLFPERLQEVLYESVKNYNYWAGVIALGTYTASRVAEQFRSGFSSIPVNQWRAAYSTGLNRLQTYRYVIVPYAFRVIIPPLTTEFLTCFKNSALTMTIGVMEATHTAYYIDSFTYRGLETTTAVSLVYLVLSFSIILFMSFVEKKIHIRGMIRKSD